jgi:hypothetical protein
LDVVPETALTIVTCTVPGDCDADAVYKPEVVIVPTAVDPPVIPFTFHVGLTRLSPPPVAVNCRLWPEERSALLGAISIVGAPVEGRIR